MAPNAKIARKATSTVMATDVTRPAQQPHRRHQHKAEQDCERKRNENLTGEIKSRDNQRDRYEGRHAGQAA
jgi:hypothetical protein